MNPYSEIIKIIDGRQRQNSLFEVGEIAGEPLMPVISGQALQKAVFAKGLLSEGESLEAGNRCLVFKGDIPVVTAVW